MCVGLRVEGLALNPKCQRTSRKSLSNHHSPGTREAGSYLVGVAVEVEGEAVGNVGHPLADGLLGDRVQCLVADERVKEGVRHLTSGSRSTNVSKGQLIAAWVFTE